MSPLCLFLKKAVLRSVWVACEGRYFPVVPPAPLPAAGAPGGLHSPAPNDRPSRPCRLRACMVAPTKIIAGLGMSLGIDVLEVSAWG